MALSEEAKKNIDGMSYREMLYKTRFAPLGDPLFCDPEMGPYFSQVMEAKKAADPGGAVAASKSIGW